MTATLIRYLLPLIPISSLTMAAQILYAWLFPTEEISQNFFSTLNDLYLFELIFMHSSLFWQGRHFMLNGNLKKRKRSVPVKSSTYKEILFGLFLFLGYGLFILPMYDKNPLLAWNYIVLNILRFFESNEVPWYVNTSLYKNGWTQAFNRCSPVPLPFLKSSASPWFFLF